MSKPNHKIIPILSGVLLIGLLTGCNVTRDAIASAAAKNVNADGYVSYQSVTTGATEDSPSPSVRLITGSVEYNSMLVAVPDGHKTPDAANYRRKTNASIWNSKSVSTTTSFSFTASSRETASEILQKIVEIDAQQINPEASK